MTIRYAGVSFWHDYDRSGTLMFTVKMAGLSRYYRSVDPPINPTMQSAPGLFWFLTSSCNGSIEIITRFVTDMYKIPLAFI